jgi:hypothetical protein
MVGRKACKIKNVPHAEFAVQFHDRQPAQWKRKIRHMFAVANDVNMLNIFGWLSHCRPRLLTSGRIKLPRMLANSNNNTQ